MADAGGSRMLLAAPNGRSLRFPRPDRSPRPVHVLVVEDNMVLRRVMVETLRGAGFEVRTTRDAMDAAESAYRTPYDLVVAEENLPGMSGLALARSLAARPHPPRFILLTAAPSSSLRKEGARAGVDWLLPKPLKLDSLKEIAGRLREDRFPPLRLSGRRSA